MHRDAEAAAALLLLCLMNVALHGEQRQKAGCGGGQAVQRNLAAVTLSELVVSWLASLSVSLARSKRPRTLDMPEITLGGFGTSHPVYI